MNDKPTIRVRLAPSPTGDVHIGTIWLAQFNWLFAKQQGGQFILRIEDTDQKRSVAGSVEKIYEALDWYGLTPDEGPQQGGPYAPYIQSERLEVYKKYVAQLIERGSAYHCFCTPERLEELRTNQQAAKQPPRYDKHCAAIPVAEAKARVAASEPHVVRVNMPTTGNISFHDIIRGQITFRYDQVDDSVLLKSDGFPTYHLAVVVDDHLMKISHVIRGEEWLSSAPKHLYIYECLGWSPPQFAHLPLILGADKKKLSKRQGATGALQFRDTGYLAVAMQNFLVLMGWHPKGESEIVSRAEALEQFQLEDINPSGAVFDQRKLDWLNGWYIRTLPPKEMLLALEPFWVRPGKVDSSWLIKALGLIQDRLKRLDEINNFINFVFPGVWDKLIDDLEITKVAAKGQTTTAAREQLLWLHKLFSGFTSTWDTESLKNNTLREIQQAQLSNLEVLWPARVALTAQTASPDIFAVADLLGREETLRRLKKTADRLT